MAALAPLPVYVGEGQGDRRSHRVRGYCAPLFLLLLALMGCAPALSSGMPTDVPTLTRPPTLHIPVTLTPRAIASTTPAPDSAAAVEVTGEAASEATVEATDEAAGDVTVEAPPVIEVIGMSAQGREIAAHHFGSGWRTLMLIGGIHGGWEANTVRLMNELIAHFEGSAGDLPADTALIIIPVLNPDGLALGSGVFAGRMNANGVDLNRNWGCDWSPNAVWRQQRVNPGSAAMSEPETRVLADYILRERPAAALFYHSTAGGVFAGTCGGDRGSFALSAVVGRATGYTYGSTFSAYPVTGTAPDWLNQQGIPSADVELFTSTDSEFQRNLRGVVAALEWIAGR